MHGIRTGAALVTSFAAATTSDAIGPDASLRRMPAYVPAGIAIPAVAARPVSLRL